MTEKLKYQVIICPDRKREVEISYKVSGSWLAPTYNIVDCPAMYDSGTGCVRRCSSLLAGAANYDQAFLGRI